MEMCVYTVALKENSIVSGLIATVACRDGYTAHRHLRLEKGKWMKVNGDPLGISLFPIEPRTPGVENSV